MKKRLFFILLSLCVFGLSHGQPSSFSPRGIGGGGALFSPSINPANPHEFYVSCDMTELFHTTDFGRSYTQAHFEQFIGGARSKVAFTDTPGLLFSLNYINENPLPVKSTDNGQTWQTLSGTPDPFGEYYSINVDRANPSRIQISTFSSVYFSTDGGNSFNGIHLTLTAAGILVAGTFFDGNDIYIGTNDGVLVSTNGGVSWSLASIPGIPLDERIASFAGARSGTAIRFFCLTGNGFDVYPGLPGSDYWDFMSGVYSCNYGSNSTWTPVMNGIAVGDDYPMFVAMAENDIQTAYLGGGSSSSTPVILKTTDAGANWGDVFLASGNQNIATGWSGDGGDRGWGYGEMPFGMAVSPIDANYIVFSDYGFVHNSRDGGGTWSQAYVDSLDQNPMNANTPPYSEYSSIGLENTSCWQIHWTDANNIWSCNSDIRGIRSVDGGDHWSFDYTGHDGNTSYRVAQDASGTMYMATSRVHDIYQSTYLQDSRLDVNDPNGKILYSTNNGAAWQDLEVFNHPVYWIALDPNNSNRAYASVIHYDGGNGVGGVYLCDDLSNLATATWTLLPDPPRTEKHPASLVVLNDGNLLATYSGRRNGSGTFTASSGLFMYDPQGNSWTDLSDSGMHYWTKDVVVDPNDPQQNTWYVAVFSGWGGAPNGLGGLYKTTDRGANWTNLTGSSLDRVTSCTFNPTNPDEIFFTTEGQGLWRSGNVNATNPPINKVVNYPFRQPERVFFNPFNTNEMWVSSFGNGMRMGLFSTVGIPEFSHGLEIFPNPTTGTINLDWQGETGEKGTIYDMQGRIVHSFILSKDLNRLQLEGLAPGMYVVQVGSKSVKVIVE